MVRVPGQVPMRAASIAGGFALLPVPALMAAWRACRSAPLGVGDFRAWIACRELAARRRALAEGRTPAYSFAELARLLGVAEKRARASVARLVAAGLLHWSESAIAFPADRAPRDDALADSIGGGRGDLAIPRRMLRLLAAGARPTLIATALGVLLRCLSRRRAGFDGRGRVKAAWIARAFAVDVRGVKAARRELVALGWIAPEPADQWALNRWGGAYRIDLAWGPSGPGDGPRLPPPPAADGPRLPPPDSDPEPLRERKDQEPASGGPAGVELRGEKGGTPPPPSLDDVQPEDLRDTGRTLRLFEQAVARELVGPSEADRLKFVAAAEHARAVGTVNPGGLFAYLVRGRLWRHLTQGDEDAANARIKRELRGPPPAVPGGETMTCRGPRLSEDARVVREVRAALIRAGHYRDPFPAFARLNPGWTRERWDRASEEVEGAGAGMRHAGRDGSRGQIEQR